jgi:hypothetical protein
MMSFLNRIFGRTPQASSPQGPALESALSSLAALYDDPEVKSERGLSLTGPRAEEVREIGRRLFKTGGKESMLAARDALRERHGWAIPNLEAIWASLPGWRS